MVDDEIIVNSSVQIPELSEVIVPVNYLVVDYRAAEMFSDQEIYIENEGESKSPASLSAEPENRTEQPASHEQADPRTPASTAQRFSNHNQEDQISDDSQYIIPLL